MKKQTLNLVIWIAELLLGKDEVMASEQRLNHRLASEYWRGFWDGQKTVRVTK